MTINLDTRAAHADHPVARGLGSLSRFASAEEDAIVSCTPALRAQPENKFTCHFGGSEEQLKRFMEGAANEAGLQGKADDV